MAADAERVIWFEQLSKDDVALVGGKNASLGEMVSHLSKRGVSVPTGFATTADAYWQFVRANGLEEEITSTLADYGADKITLSEAGQKIRRAFLHGEWPIEIRNAICAAYLDLSKRIEKTRADVAVRSSATAEDLPDASFAGQQETFLNVRGEEALMASCRRCYASLFADRAISYRQAKGFDHLRVALSVGVQNMVRSNLGGAGAILSIDTETSFERVVHNQCRLGVLVRT